jgi:hypothetical protein
MHLAEIAELGAIGDAAAGGDRGASGIQARKVPPKPWLALREELLDVPFGASPATPCCERDGHDNAMPGIDRHPERARPG